MRLTSSTGYNDEALTVDDTDLVSMPLAILFENLAKCVAIVLSVYVGINELVCRRLGSLWRPIAFIPPIVEDRDTRSEKTDQPKPEK